jgi:hypothetical protein
MADVFIDVPIETDEQTLADQAVDNLRNTWPDWEPNDGDLEVVQIETLAPMAAEAARAASVMPGAAFRAILAKLHGVDEELGSAATTTLTFTMTDTAAHTITAGTEVDVDGVAFTVDSDTPTAALSVPGVPVTASVIGVVGNGLAGDVVTLITSLAFVAGAAVDTPTAGGTDPESEQDYEDRGSRELQLQAKTLVTARDYELMGLSVDGIGRITATSDPTTRTVEVTVATAEGEVVPTPIKTTLDDLYQEYRLSTWTVSEGDPTYTTIDVTFAIHPYPGYDTVDLLTRANAALTDWLDPANWARPREFGDAVTTRWYNEPRARINKAIDLLGDVEGVDYVDSISFTGDVGTVQTNGDWLLAGTVALTRPGTMSGSVV